MSDSSYRTSATALLTDPAVSFALKRRISEDDNRDPADALNDAEKLHELASQRFHEAPGTFARETGALAAERGGRTALIAAGTSALTRLFKVAHGHSGQCRYIARYLLGLYNGTRFPFDLTDLRAIDDDLYADCMAVLAMDARVTPQEVHTFFKDGNAKFEQLASDWRMLDLHALKIEAKELAQRASTSPTLCDQAEGLLRRLEADR